MITITQLIRLPRWFRKYYEQQFVPLLEESGLTMRDLHVLLFLANHPEQDTARDVAEVRGLAKSQVSQAVETLTGRGWLRRTPSRSDRRVVHLTITGEGIPLAREAQAIQAACGQRLLAGLSEAEQALFLDLLERILNTAEQLTEGVCE
ncbi:MAG: MarR family transcriptional regulator [Oscillibacter sp.]|nr:MarR family transcriptional regulator [Oscillibacter sp.]